MSTNDNLPPSLRLRHLWRSWRCRLRWLLTRRYHQLYVVQEFYPDMRRVVCQSCGGDWMMNDRLQAMLDWNQEFEDCVKLSVPVVKPWRNV